MENIGVLNQRTIIYQRFADNIKWAVVMPNKNWLLLIISDKIDVERLNEIVSASISNGVCYACCAGKQGALFEDKIDDEWELRSEGFKEGYYLPMDVLSTTRHDNLDDALWFSCFCANNYNEPEIVKVIFCIDASENSVKEELEDLIGKFSSGDY